jgi:hypothetical protein
MGFNNYGILDDFGIFHFSTKPNNISEIYCTLLLPRNLRNWLDSGADL